MPEFALLDTTGKLVSFPDVTDPDKLEVAHMRTGHQKKCTYRGV